MSHLPHLPDPIGDVLDQDVDEERIQKIWSRTATRVRRRSPATSPRVRALFWGAPLALGAAAVLFLLTGAPEEPGPLLLADGSVPVATTAPGDVPSERIEYSDQSWVELGSGTHLTPETNDRSRFQTTLAGGRGIFQVTPGQSRQWVVRAGSARVEVLGTRFLVDAQPELTRVEVYRGTVRVWAPRLPREGAVLGVGESVEIREREPAPESLSNGTDPGDGTDDVDPSLLRDALAPGPVTAETSDRPRPSTIDRRTARTWRHLAEVGSHSQAYEEIGGTGIRAETPRATPEELMLLADVARLSGHPAEAVAPLERLISESPGDPRSPLAAIILGRIQMDRLGHPEEARRALERARALGVPTALAADVDSRLERLGAAEPTP